MNWVLHLALFSLTLSLGSACDEACQAYVWGFPLWHAVNQRYLSTLSPHFAANVFGARVGQIPQPGQIPQLAVCNATLCSGVPTEPINVSPINAPYVYFVYGAFTWDFGQGNATYPFGGAIKFVLPPNTASRYGSLVLYDAYTNIVDEFNTQDQTTTAATVFCLAQIPNHPACAAFPPGTMKLVIPNHGFAIVRGFSNGTPDSTCGVNGCEYILGAGQNYAVVYPPVNVIDYALKYGPYMNDTECPYVYGQPPCGLNGNRKAFWQALCVALADNPVTGDEATYVNATFANLGIHSTGCDANLAFDRLDLGLLEGYLYVFLNLGNSGINAGPWSFLPFGGNWAVHDAQSALIRSISSQRLEFMNSNHTAVYWTAFTDSSGIPLSGLLNATYRLNWTSQDAFVDSQRGFWSIHLYDSTAYLYNPPAGTDQHQYAFLGTGIPSGEIHFANTCGNSGSPCIRSPPTGLFNIMFRAYVYLPNIAPNGGYQFPTITRCSYSSPCN